MSRIALWVIGEPGAGKTTLVRRFVEQDSYLVQAPKWTVGEKVAAAGHYTGTKFDGADTVPYNGVEAALAFWTRELAGKELTIFDGDRFSYVSCVEHCRLSGAQPRAVLLVVPPEEGLRRRTERGSNQNPAWVKGRITKSKRFFQTFNLSLLLDATRSTDELEEQLRMFLSRE